MTYDQLMKHYGSQKDIAAVAKITIDGVKRWQQRDFVPIGQQWRFYALTGGKLKVSK